MLCVTLQSYTRLCGALAGGISDILFFDPSDFNFTQVNAKAPYSAVVRRTGVTAIGGGNFFPVTFQDDDESGADRTWKQSTKGCNVKYAHEVHGQLPQLSQALTNFLSSLDSAGCCCGLGLIIRHNDNKIFVMGEKYVNGSSIPKFVVKMAGSDGSSGKLDDDFNGVNFVITGSYSRDLFEYSGTWASIEAYLDQATPTTFDTALTFVSSVSDSDGAVGGTAGATNANLKFEYNTISDTEGLPLTMEIKVATVSQLVVDYPGDYEGQPFKFTDNANVVHTGVFTSGEVNF